MLNVEVGEFKNNLLSDDARNLVRKESRKGLQLKRQEQFFLVAASYSFKHFIKQNWKHKSDRTALEAAILRVLRPYTIVRATLTRALQPL